MVTEMRLFDKKVGESIEIELDRYGKFSATLQKIEGNPFTFMFDDCIVLTSMNQEDTNKGGYRESYMERFLSTDVYNTFPEDIRKYLKEVTLPTAGQIFGHDNEWCNKYLVMDENEQFPLMKKRKNRIACFDDAVCWWWLQNPVKKEYSSANFAVVSAGGCTHAGNASNSDGVRPVFTLIRPTSGDHVPHSENWEDILKYCYNDVIAIKEVMEHLEFDETANKTKAMMDSYIRAGFTKEQAFRLVLELSVAAIGGMRR